MYKVETETYTYTNIVKMFSCDQREYKPKNKNGRLTKDKQSRHGGKKYPFDSCDYQATGKASLSQHKQSRHEGKMYPCASCDYQAGEKGSPSRHMQ